MRKKIISWLYFILGKLQEKDNQKEYLERIEKVKITLHEFLPEIDDFWRSKAIIENGIYNFFYLPSGEFPRYHFVIPEIPLYIVVSGLESADWSQARSRGITREKWETSVLDLEFLDQKTNSLATIETARKPKILIIRWNDPISHLSLADRIQELISNANS